MKKRLFKQSEKEVLRRLALYINDFLSIEAARVPCYSFHWHITNVFFFNYNVTSDKMMRFTVDLVMDLLPSDHNLINEAAIGRVWQNKQRLEDLRKLLEYIK